MRFSDGKFIVFQKFYKDSIDTSQLKKYGITIKGQEVRKLDYIVDFDVLIKGMLTNLNTHWHNWLNDCRRFPSIKYIGLFISPKLVEWGVLDVSGNIIPSRKGI